MVLQSKIFLRLQVVEFFGEMHILEDKGKEEDTMTAI